MPTIYHTNDLHGALDEACEARLEGLLLREPGLLLDAGDAVAAGNLGFRPGGEPVLRRMTRLGYAAMAMGNREFHPLPGLMRLKLADAGFPVLCANLDQPHGQPICGSSLIMDCGRRRLAVIGLGPDMIGDAAGRLVSPFRFLPAAEATEREIKKLSGRADLFIVLSHMGLEADLRLASEVPGLDLIIGGHSHDELPGGRRIGETLVVQAGHHAGRIGRIRLTERGLEAALVELKEP